MDTFLADLKTTARRAHPLIAFFAILFASLTTIPLDMANDFSARQIFVLVWIAAPVAYVLVRREIGIALLGLGALLELIFNYHHRPEQTGAIATWIIALVATLLPHKPLSRDDLLVKRVGVAAAIWSLLVVIVGLTPSVANDDFERLQQNFWSVQNFSTILSAAIFCGAILMLTRRPVVSFTIAVIELLVSLVAGLDQLFRYREMFTLPYGIEVVVLSIASWAALTIVAVQLVAARRNRSANITEN